VEETNAGLTADALFVGATRPPMRWGVTYAALLFNMVFTMEIFLASRNLLTLLICVPLHGVSAMMCARDERIFDLFLLWMQTRFIAFFANMRYWNASSYSPLRIDMPRRGRRTRSADVVPGSC